MNGADNLSAISSRSPAKSSQSPMYQQISSFLKMVIKELKATPYQSYTVLRYPGLFQKYQILDKSLSVVQDNDIIVFLSANPGNLTNL